MVPSGTVIGLQDSGNASKTTRIFSVPANWTLQYTCDCTQFAGTAEAARLFGTTGAAGLFNVFVMYPTGAYLLNDSSPITPQPNGDTGSASVTLATGGTFDLFAFAACPWTMSIPDAVVSASRTPPIPCKDDTISHVYGPAICDDHGGIGP